MVFGRNRKVIGDESELIARKYLEQQGLTYVGCNFRCRGGEIDLIMKDRCQLVFIEVRYRSRSGYGSAADTVTRKKQRRIILAARYYLHKHHLTENVSGRFDVVAVDACDDNNQRVTWLQDAFSAD